MNARRSDPPTCRYCGERIRWMQADDDSWVPMEFETIAVAVRGPDGRVRWTTGYRTHIPNCSDRSGHGVTADPPR